MFNPLRGECDLLLELVDIAHEQSEAVSPVERLFLVVGEIIDGTGFVLSFGSDSDPFAHVRRYEVQDFESLLVLEREYFVPTFDFEGVVSSLQFDLLLARLKCYCSLV